MIAPSDKARPERILIVDDDVEVCRLIETNLGDAGLSSQSAHTATAALSAVARLKPSLVILDLMLPDLPGTEVCRRLRMDPATRHVAILMLTARADEYDRVVGFELGTDDYVVKPFSVRELVLRVRALLRRCADRRITLTDEEEAALRLRWRGLVLDAARHEITLDGAALLLRPLEFKLLNLFLAHPGEVYGRERLLSEVWGITADVATRTVDTHVRRLRERLGPYGDAIETVHGFGYRLRPA